MYRGSRANSPFFFLSLFSALIFAFLVHAGGLLVGPPDGPQRYQPHFYPFDGGENIKYQASWFGIPVASAEIRADPKFIDGKKFYHVQIQTRTLKYLDPIWKMRDSIESVFEAETLQTRRFVFRQRENRKRIETTASFDPRGQKWMVHREQGAKVNDYEFVSHFTLDPVSAVYLARSLDFKIGDTLRLDVFGGKSRYLIVLDIIGQERITLKTVDFDAYKIVPRVFNLTPSGYAERVRQATVWISVDEKRRPLKIVSEVFIGSVNIELVEAKG